MNSCALIIPIAATSSPTDAAVSSPPSAAALMMLWAMDLTTETLRAESARRPRRAQTRASNHNGIYDVALNPLFPQSLSETLSQMIENTKRQREGG